MPNIINSNEGLVAGRWQEVCNQITSTMGVDTRDMAEYWLLKVLPSWETFLVATIHLGEETAMSSSGLGDDPHKLYLNICEPGEFFRTLKGCETRLGGMPSHIQVIAGGQEYSTMPLEKMPLETVFVFALSRATPYELAHDPAGCVSRYIGELECANSSTHRDEVIVAGTVSVGSVDAKLSIRHQNEELIGTEAPSIVDFSFTPNEVIPLIDSWNRLCHIASRDYESLTLEDLAELFMLHSVRYGLSSDKVARVYALQNRRTLSYVLDPETFFDDDGGRTLKNRLKSADLIITFRQLAKKARIDSVISLQGDKYSGLEDLLADVDKRLTRLRELCKNYDGSLYSLDTGLPKVTTEERAYRKGIHTPEVAVYNPQSTRHVPRAGFASFVCAMAMFHRAGVREVEIPLFMGMRYMENLSSYGEPKADQIQGSMTNTLARVALRASEQVIGIQVRSYGDDDYMMRLRLGSILSSDNPAIRSILKVFKDSDRVTASTLGLL